MDAGYPRGRARGERHAHKRAARRVTVEWEKNVMVDVTTKTLLLCKP
jgi:hypothetical protein